MGFVIYPIIMDKFSFTHIECSQVQPVICLIRFFVLSHGFMYYAFLFIHF